MKVIKKIHQRQEADILKEIRHPNIVRLYEIIDDPKHHKAFMIMEFHQKNLMH